MHIIRGHQRGSGYTEYYVQALHDPFMLFTLLHWYGDRTVVLRLQNLADVGKLWCSSAMFILMCGSSRIFGWRSTPSLLEP